MTDVVVIGGGLVGTACAFELARDGHSVTVVDRRDVGRATDAGAGILSPETYGGSVPSFLDLADLAGAHYRDLVRDLAELGAPDPRYAVCGALRVGFREADDDLFEASAEEARSRHPGVLEVLSVDDARLRFPPLGEIRHALFNPRGARVDGRAMVAAVEHASRARGVAWRTGEEARIVVDRGRVRGVETATGNISCGTVVIAGGAWTTELAGAFGMRTGVRPVRGQIVHLRLDADTGRWPVLQPVRSHYVVPWPEGRLALGATVEDAGFDARPTAAGLRLLFSEGLRLCPGLGDATFLEVRVGLRPVSDDDLPVIGALPGVDGVVVASGHGANGLLLGPVTGRVVADVVSGRAPPLDLGVFSPARFV
jgi:D-amino-acid dehydrogenase